MFHEWEVCNTREYISLSLRLKDLLGPVTRVKKKKKTESRYSSRVTTQRRGVSERKQGDEGLRVQGSWFRV